MDLMKDEWNFWSTNGILIETGYYNMGRPHGEHSGWYGSGKRKWKINYLSGKLNGSYVYWHENGQVEISGEYSNGQKIGTWNKWDNNGKLIEQDSYERY